jgi:hypothetical protein
LCDRKNHYVKKEWPVRKTLVPGVKNVEKESLVDPKKILLPPLHIKLGLMKQFVKALPKGPLLPRRYQRRVSVGSLGQWYIHSASYTSVIVVGESALAGR